MENSLQNNGENLKSAENPQQLTSKIPSQGNAAGFYNNNAQGQPTANIYPGMYSGPMPGFSPMPGFTQMVQPGFYPQQQLSREAYTEMVAKSFSQQTFFMQNPLANPPQVHNQSQDPGLVSAPLEQVQNQQSAYNQSNAGGQNLINNNIINASKDGSAVGGGVEQTAGAGSSAAPQQHKPRVMGKWIEYKSEDGYFYYYDSITKKTQWEKPKEFDIIPVAKKFKTNESKSSSIISTSSSPKPQSATNANGDEKGKNLKNTKDSQSPRLTQTLSGKKPSVETTEANSTQLQNTFSVLSHEECVKMFRALLEEQNIEHDAEWAGILSDIIKDARYSAIKTLGERKKIFAEYCEKKKKDYHKKKKEETERKMKAFYEMLKTSDSVGLDTKFSEIETMFSNDSRFKDLKYIEKRSLFSKYREDLRRKEKEDAKKLYKENAPLFAKLLKESDKVNHNSEWEDVKEHFIHEDCVKNLRALERLSVFKKNKAELQKRHKREKEQKKELQKSQEKDFKKLLHEMAFDNNLFHSKSRWGEVIKLPELSESKQYKVFLEDSSRRRQPAKIFERFCCDLEDRIASGKAKLKKFLRQIGHRVKVEDTVKELLSIYKESAEKPSVKSEQLGVIFLEMIAKAKYKQQKKSK